MNSRPAFHGQRLRRASSLALVSLLLHALSAPCVEAAEGAVVRPRLGIGRLAGELELRWPATVDRDDGSKTRPWFEVQHSEDLATWRPVSHRLHSESAEVLTLGLAGELQRGFYRVLAVAPVAKAAPGEGGAEVFGYGAAFDQALERVGQITPEEFARRYASGAEYGTGLSWDPTTATFWDQFNANPWEVNQGITNGQQRFRSVDYRLSPPELEVFKRLGFVVSPRLARQGVFDPADYATVGNCYYQLWYNDLPVFITTDSVLHAWHRTYSLILQEVEEAFLAAAVEEMLQRMSDRLGAVWEQAESGVLRDSVRDADFLLTVARSLLRGQLVSSPLGQDALVAATWKDIEAEQLKTVPDFMGHCRVVDYSQFKVRGHYTRSELLGRYFRCVMWLGRIDLPVAGGPFERCPGETRMASPRELGTALVLHELAQGSGALDRWREMDAVIGFLVGWNDSLTFPQLEGVLAGAGIESLRDVADLAALERVQRLLEQGELGVQNIRSDAFFAPLNEGAPRPLPRSLLVFGQRFVPDSWVLSKVVFDSIVWTENGVKMNIQRRVPSALDVAFAALGNNQAVPEILGRIGQRPPAQGASHTALFRDGLPYQHNLAAARDVLDAQRPEAWNSTVPMGWMATLRELSPPTTGAEYPEVMRSKAWAMRTLNTQLASWTQYRHDTVLYAKQSYTSIPLCYYPAGYVEPRPAFWGRLSQLASRTAEGIEGLRYPDQIRGDSVLSLVSPAVIQSNQVAHLRRFAAMAETLRGMADKELRQQPFSADEELVIRNLMQQVGWDPMGSGRTPRYSGWYPELFYRPIRHSGLVPDPGWEPMMWVDHATFFHEKYGANAADELVVDVHTDLPAPMVGDPGSVLHEGVGRVGLMLIAVDNGADRVVYAGP
ncbi:MAG: DUF3160 domain-containing protein, partial [Verrucomicrobiales bacterium]|nr:DUF3160 domain-containing protein [Verrucomicrobiales bacterium]